MTDPRDPRHDAPHGDTGPDGAGDPAPGRDEVVSAYLDGEATPSEVVRVETDPALGEPDLAERLGAFAEVRSAVRDLPPPPAGVLDAARAAALAAFDEEVAGGTLGAGRDGDASDTGERAGDGAAVAPIAAAGSRRRQDPRPWWQRSPLGAVAAAVAVAALAVGVLGTVGSGEDDVDTAAELPTGAAITEESGGDAAFDAAESLEAAPDASGGAGAAPSLRFSSTDALADYLVDQLARDEASSGSAAPDDPADGEVADDRATAESAPADDGTGGSTPDPCDAVRLLGLDPVTVVTVVGVLVDDRPVTAVVHGTEPDARRLVVVDDASCAVVVDEALA